MKMVIFIQPHERHEALEAYRQWLSPEQEDVIRKAPDNALIRLARTGGKTGVCVIDLEKMDTDGCVPD